MDNTKGLIFNIVHGSFVDGYGIRTTIFLKGCPLKCTWCCNPEGQSFNTELRVISADCNGCGNCVSACSEKKAIKIKKEKDKFNVSVDRKLCNNCGECIDVCYTGALSFYGQYYTVDEMFDLIKKDEQFYRSSGGGVTIGGGEATWYPDFTLNLIRKCKENYINTAVDTCGYVTSENGLKALEEADLLLFDFKIFDEDEHIKYTGVSNKIIKENLKKLDAMGQSIIIRVPVIPGCSDSDENLNSIAEFLSKLKSIERVDILPVHEYGKAKYAEIGMEYKLHVNPISIERQKEIIELFKSYGLNAQIGG
jgi:pyruvate formate lyase activating enzyme